MRGYDLLSERDAEGKHSFIISYVRISLPELKRCTLRASEYDVQNVYIGIVII